MVSRIVTLAAAVSLCSAAPALSGQIVGHVTAQSDIGQQTVSGPVRATRRGLQVQLPGGTWVYCETSCSETLRLETVDFWDSEASGNRNPTTTGPGIFGKLQFGW